MPVYPSPTVWGPHYWFFLHSVAYYYPATPNQTTKRKYYDLIQNMPLFIPNESIGNRFSRLLDKYPVSPYLNSRESFLRWVNFIHNKVNHMIGKDEMSFEESLNSYETKYDPQHYINYNGSSYIKTEIYTQLAFLAGLCLFLYYCYRKKRG
jgi:hypothetical protein